MIEIKIRFKSGDVGYFKFLNEVHDAEMEACFDFLGDRFKNQAVGVIELIDLADNKRTYVNMSEIASFGYSNV